MAEEGRLTAQEAERLQALARRDTGSLAINVLMSFGAGRGGSRIIALEPAFMTGAALSVALVTIGLGISYFAASELAGCGERCKGMEKILIGLAKTSAYIGALGAFLVAVSLAAASDNLTIERLATCQDSWLDWKQNDRGRLDKFANELRSGFSHKENDPFFIPNSNLTVVGLPVARVFPESVGMGVGFSVWVSANFDRTKIALERKTGRLLKQCEVGDNMRTCSLELGEKKTIVLMAEDNPKSTTTLIGCYYFYEK